MTFRHSRASFNKVDFPDPGKGYTDAYVQIEAQMMGYEGHDNGAWDALWFLGSTNSQLRKSTCKRRG
jgi:hypothetical protein